jgi:hypothetical protein
MPMCYILASWLDSIGMQKFNGQTIYVFSRVIIKRVYLNYTVT